MADYGVPPNPPYVESKRILQPSIYSINTAYKDRTSCADSTMIACKVPSPTTKSMVRAPCKVVAPGR